MTFPFVLVPISGAGGMCRDGSMGGEAYSHGERRKMMDGGE